MHENCGWKTTRFALRYGNGVIMRCDDHPYARGTPRTTTTTTTCVLGDWIVLHVCIYVRTVFSLSRLAKYVVLCEKLVEMVKNK